MPAIVDTVREGVQRQIATVRSAATTPKGPFEVVDEVVRNARTTARSVLGTAGVRVPSFPTLRTMLGRNW